jgi:hypothetical protein
LKNVYQTYPGGGLYPLRTLINLTPIIIQNIYVLKYKILKCNVLDFGDWAMAKFYGANPPNLPDTRLSNAIRIIFQ